MGNPATGQQLNHFRSDARGAIDRSQTELKSAFWNVLSTPINYVYAADQRLVQINSGSSLLAGYAYDAFGRRVGKTRPGKPLHTFAYAGSQLLAENAGTPSHYAYLDGEPLARIDGSAANSPIYYFHNHPLGVPLKASNAAGQTVWAAQLQPFGLMQTTTATISQNLRFPGQYFDAESGLHYNMARYYSPELGRYLQSDPIGLAGGINTYTYVRNSPLNRIDPLGLYDTSGCSPAQCAQIANAVDAAQNAANGEGIGSQFSQILDKTTFTCRTPGKGADYCGVNRDPTIYLKNAFNKNQCGPLSSTIEHEVSHSAPLNYSETDAYVLEYKSFGTPMPSPKQFRSDYPQLPDVQYQYYQEQYKKVMGQ
ncbi:RHS repeat-associated core domain-containing protein [Methylomonas koyamae]|uniref:RHS repeat-associated core domain-containing protein n=1 Tax=Methylomonas koyamae TaxID=702114 RepID=UPI002873804E|nr:RHS repeat-associated core domain-containing protein [Methylomonas koyamae]WNB75567.1 RHS repeat-associated core domain-containing protein [Methylomonas koyamae]